MEAILSKAASYQDMPVNGLEQAVGQLLTIEDRLADLHYRLDAACFKVFGESPPNGQAVINNAGTAAPRAENLFDCIRRIDERLDKMFQAAVKL